MSSTVVDGGSQIKLIHSKQLIPSRWLGGWMEFHKIGVWGRNQRDWRAPFSFRDHGDTRGVFKQRNVAFAELRGQGTSQAGTANTGRSRKSSGKAPGPVCTSWPSEGSSHGFYTDPSLHFMLCLMQESCRHQGEILLCFLCGGLFHVIPLGGTMGFGGSGEWLVPPHSTETGPKWSPPQDSISDTHF